MRLQVFAKPLLILHWDVEITLSMRYCFACKSLDGERIKRLMDPFPGEEEAWELPIKKSDIKLQMSDCDLCKMLFLAMQNTPNKDLDYPQLEAREDGVLLIKKNHSQVCLELYSNCMSA